MKGISQASILEVLKQRECNFELNIDTDTKVIEKGLNNPGKYFSKNKSKKRKRMTNEYNQYLEQYNQIVSNKLKTKGVYELIELWNKTEDTRFKNLAKEIIREIYVDLYNITNKRHSDYMKDNLYSNDYYSKKKRKIN